ncbi:MAG: alpha/beta hydrolase [Thermodesulfobacteriota bacterium]|nr:alpha/beta hydrolase [Thermodesulfobacteriota bacterium]
MTDRHFLERSFIFFPERELLTFPSNAGMEYEDVHFRCEDGVTLHGWFIPGLGKSVMLFFHGNGGNISHRIEKIRLLCHPQISSFMIDYHGYGRSRGIPSEESCYLDALASWNYLIQERRIDPKQIVLFGESLGGAVAIDLASKKEVGAVILESTFTPLEIMPRCSAAGLHFRLIPAGFNAPLEFLTGFTNIGAVMGRFVPGLESLLKGRFDSLSIIPHLKVPLLILHGDEDELVPFELGQSLFEKANEPKNFFTILGAHHNDTYDVGGKAYVETIRQFIKRHL